MSKIIIKLPSRPIKVRIVAKPPIKRIVVRRR